MVGMLPPRPIELAPRSRRQYALVNERPGARVVGSTALAPTDALDALAVVAGFAVGAALSLTHRADGTGSARGALLPTRARSALTEATDAVRPTGLADSVTGRVATDAANAVAGLTFGTASADCPERKAWVNAHSGPVTLATDAGRDVLAASATCREARLALLLRGPAGPERGTEIGGEVGGVGDTDSVARWAVDPGAADVVAGAHVADAKTRASLTCAITGILAAAAVDAAVALAVAVDAAASAIRVRSVHAAPSRGTALAVRTDSLATDLARALQRGFAFAGPALAVERASCPQRQQTLPATGALAAVAAQRVGTAGGSGTATARLARTVARFASAIAVAAATNAIGTATPDTVLIGRATGPSIALRSDAHAFSVAELPRGAGFGATDEPRSHGGLTVACAARIVAVARCATRQEARAPAKALQCVAAARAVRLRDTGARGIARLTRAVASFGATHAVNAGALPAFNVALTSGAQAPPRIDAVTRLVAHAFNAGGHLRADRIDRNRDRIALRLADPEAATAIDRLRLVKASADIRAFAGDHGAAQVVGGHDVAAAGRRARFADTITRALAAATRDTETRVTGFTAEAGGPKPGQTLARYIRRSATFKAVAR